jgi:hypothetical protein
MGPGGRPIRATLPRVRVVYPLRCGSKFRIWADLPTKVCGSFTALSRLYRKQTSGFKITQTVNLLPHCELS